MDVVRSIVEVADATFDEWGVASNPSVQFKLLAQGSSNILCSFAPATFTAGLSFSASSPPSGQSTSGAAPLVTDGTSLASPRRREAVLRSASSSFALVVSDAALFLFSDAQSTTPSLLLCIPILSLRRVAVDAAPPAATLTLKSTETVVFALDLTASDRPCSSMKRLLSVLVSLCAYASQVNKANPELIRSVVAASLGFEAPVHELLATGARSAALQVPAAIAQEFFPVPDLSSSPHASLPGSSERLNDGGRVELDSNGEPHEHLGARATIVITDEAAQRALIDAHAMVAYGLPDSGTSTVSGADDSLFHYVCPIMAYWLALRTTEPLASDAEPRARCSIAADEARAFFEFEAKYQARRTDIQVREARTAAEHKFAFEARLTRVNVEHDLERCVDAEEIGRWKIIAAELTDAQGRLWSTKAAIAAHWQLAAHESTLRFAVILAEREERLSTIIAPATSLALGATWVGAARDRTLHGAVSPRSGSWGSVGARVISGSQRARFSSASIPSAISSQQQLYPIDLVVNNKCGATALVLPWEEPLHVATSRSTTFKSPSSSGRRTPSPRDPVDRAAVRAASASHRRVLLSPR